MVSRQIKIVFVALATLVLTGWASQPARATSFRWYFHDASSTIAVGALLSTTTPHVAVPAAYTTAPSITTQGTNNMVFRFRPGVASPVSLGSWAYNAAEPDNNLDNVDEAVTGGNHIATSTLGPTSQRGWWTDTPLTGTFASSTWQIRQATSDNRSAVVSHGVFYLWKVPQNTSTSGAAWIPVATSTQNAQAVAELGSFDDWTGGGFVTPALTTVEFSVATMTLNAEFLFVEVFDHSTTVTAGRLQSLAIEGSDKPENNKLSITTNGFVPGLTQSAYRWFNNRDSTDVNAAYVAQDTAATATTTGEKFRLRLLLHSPAQLDRLFSTTTFTPSWTLQSAVRSGTCDTGFVGESYATVTPASGDIRYFDNPVPADGAALTVNAGDPTHGSHTTVNQTYGEGIKFENAVATTSAVSDSMWDFSLQDFSAPGGTIYCFRAVNNDGTLLSTYSVIPEFTTLAAANPDLQQLHYRFRQDTVAENVNDAWLAAQDTAADVQRTSTARLRIEISNEGTAASAQTRFRLEYGIQPAGGCSAITTWRPVGDVGSTTPDWAMTDSAFLLENASTTNFAGSLTDENGTFAAGNAKRTSNQTIGFTLTGNPTTGNFIEHEFTVTPLATTTANTTYCFRTTDAGASANFTFSVFPRAKITVPAAGGGGAGSQAGEPTPPAFPSPPPGSGQGGSTPGGEPTPPAAPPPPPGGGQGGGGGESGYAPPSSSALAAIGSAALPGILLTIFGVLALGYLLWPRKPGG